MTGRRRCTYPFWLWSAVAIFFRPLYVLALLTCTLFPQRPRQAASPAPLPPELTISSSCLGPSTVPATDRPTPVAGGPKFPRPRRRHLILTGHGINARHGVSGCQKAAVQLVEIGAGRETHQEKCHSPLLAAAAVGTAEGRGG